jgi:ATP-dependent Clp protease ATP-binding subunit ClpB
LLILTSNLGSQYLVDPTLDTEKQHESVRAVVRASFKPEFLNRLDEIVMFDALGKDELAHIVDLQLAAFDRRLAPRRITVAVTDAARSWLTVHGYDPAYGARPLKRVIQREVQDRLAEAILNGDVQDGQKVLVDAGDGGLMLVPELEGEIITPAAAA